MKFFFLTAIMLWTQLPSNLSTNLDGFYINDMYVNQTMMRKTEPEMIDSESSSTSLNIISTMCNIGVSLKMNLLYPSWICTTATTSEMICTWNGVTCQSGVVVSLALASKGLTGSIPTSIGNLLSLTYLDLSRNSLKSSIPTSMGMLSNVQYIWLSMNELTSFIPTNIALLSNLQAIGLAYNSLTSIIPTQILSLTSVTFLDFSGNKLTSSIPSTIAMLSNVREMWLNNNEFTSSIPTSIGSLTRLTGIALSNNKLTSSIPTSIGFLMNLQVIWFDNNELSSSIPTSIGMLANVQTITLNNNKLTSSIPTSIGMALALTMLFLSYNSLTGSIPTTIGYLANLFYLDGQENSFSSSIPSSICLCSTLMNIWLPKNNLSGSIPSCIGLLNNVRSLVLSHNSLSSVIPSSLGDLLTLEYLYLEHNLFTSTVPTSLSQLSIVVVIDLSNNFLTGYIDSRICQLSNLVTINLRNNRFPCQPTCQTDGVWNANATLPRCPDNQDIALYALETSLGVSEAQGRIVYTSTRLFSFSLMESLPSFVSIFLGDFNAFEYKIDGFAVMGSGSVILLCLDKSCQQVVEQITGTTRIPGLSGFRVSATVSNKQCYLVIKNSYPGYGIYSFKVKTRVRNPSNWAFIHQTTGQATASRLCQQPWVGVTCEKGDVIALDLKGYGLKGPLPTSIGLLSSLRSLDLSYNLITGSLHSSLGLMTSLDTLKLTGNKLKGFIPQYMTNLLALYFVDLSYNFFSKSIPSVLYKLSSLAFVYIDGNSFTGEVPAEMCKIAESTNTTFTLTALPGLTCYQEECWSTAHPSHRHFDSTLRMCSPTTSPSSHPTSAPSQMPVPPVNSSSQITIVVGAVIGGGLLFLLAASLFIYCKVYRVHFSKKAIEIKRKKSTLLDLPIHHMLLNGGDDVTENEIMTCIKNNYESAGMKDFDDRTAFDIIFQDMNAVPISAEIVRELLCHYLPIGRNKNDDTCKIWSDAVQQCSDAVVKAVISIIQEHRADIIALANVTDALGRLSKDIASRDCKNAMFKALCLHGRYSLKDGPPEHRSATSLVLFAVDCPEEVPTQSNVGKAVALKFMLHRHQFQNEIKSREDGGFDKRFVVPILIAYDGDGDSKDDREFRQDAIAKGFQEYPYCIVMEAATQSLKHIIDHDNIASLDLHRVKELFRQLTLSLAHLHEKGVIHGDIKPLNILQSNGLLKLTDLDASASFRDGGLVSGKYSSGYLPTEMVFFEDCDIPGVRTDVEAHPSQDMWALGCVLYMMCTGSTLFHVKVDDNLDSDEDFVDLIDWDDDFKAKKLLRVPNKLARNLISLLLMGDPGKRYSAARVLSHPFLTGQPSPRLPGEAAAWDIFLSYRVDSEAQFVEQVYEALIVKGKRVWWDKKCLLPGQNWEEGFCTGLVSSAFFVCLLSRDAIKCAVRDRHNFEKLSVDSPCDNVLLEWRLALELKERGMIEGVFPVMIGDKDPVTLSYTNYFRSGCHPYAPALSVRSVEMKLKEHLNRAGLGLPYLDDVPVRDVLSTVTSNQGGFIEGDLRVSLGSVVETIIAMSIHPKRRMQRLSSKWLSSRQLVANAEQDKLIAQMRAKEEQLLLEKEQQDELIAQMRAKEEQLLLEKEQQDELIAQMKDKVEKLLEPQNRKSAIVVSDSFSV